MSGVKCGGVVRSMQGTPLVKTSTTHKRSPSPVCYRVILDEIDAERETPDTFAIKLSLRTRSTLPRARGLVRHLPRVIREGLDAEAAKRLRAVLEDIGGRARVERYRSGPGRGGRLADAIPDASDRAQPGSAHAPRGDVTDSPSRGAIALDAGTPETPAIAPEQATAAPDVSQEVAPADPAPPMAAHAAGASGPAPLEPAAPPRPASVAPWWRRHIAWIVAGVAIAGFLFLIFK